MAVGAKYLTLINLLTYRIQSVEELVSRLPHVKALRACVLVGKIQASNVVLAAVFTGLAQEVGTDEFPVPFSKGTLL